MRNGIAAGLAALALLAALAVANAQQPQQPQQAVWTKVSLTELHCEGCLKKIATQVNAVPGVGEVRGDLTTKTVWVLHKPGTNPSPRGIWDAVEKADHKDMIIQMQGPAGTFKAKPQQ